jgi:hypothetical protein
MDFCFSVTAVKMLAYSLAVKTFNGKILKKTILNYANEISA